MDLPKVLRVTRTIRSRREKRSRRISRPLSARVESESNIDTVHQYFQVSINILEARKLAWSNPQSPNSYVIAVLGKKKHRTGIKKNAAEPCYREFFTFEMFVSMRDLQSSSIWMAVMEPRCCAPPRLLGEATIDLGAIWAQPHHQVFHKWAQLCLPRDHEAGPVGFLKVDISIMFRGEVQTVIPLSESKEKVDDNLLLPSGSEQQRANYLVTIYGAFGLPNNASHSQEKRQGKPPSTFVRTSFCGLTAKTAVQRRNNNPTYCEQVSIVEMFPNMNQLIRLEMCAAEGYFHKVIACTDLQLGTISHDGENGFLPTFGPSLLHMYASTSAGPITSSEEHGPYHRGALLISLRTIVPYYQQGVRSISVEPVPVIQLENLWVHEDFCLFAPILEMSMLDRRLTGKTCGLAITIAEISCENHADEEFAALRTQIRLRKLHYTGGLEVYKKKFVYGYTHFPNVFPILQLAIRLPDFRFRMHRNNMVLGIVANLEKVLSVVERRLKLFEYTSPNELMEELNRAIDDSTASILKFLDIIQYSNNTNGNETLQQNSTDLDFKQLALQKEEIEKIFHLMSRKNKGESLISLGYKGTRENAVGSRKCVKVLLAETKANAKSLKNVIFKTTNGWPEIVVWLLNESGSRVAFTKIPPAEVIYSVIPEQCGSSCGRIQNIYLKPLKCPKHANTQSAGCHCIAGRVELQLWMGLYRQKYSFDDFILPGYVSKINKLCEMYLNTSTMMLECRAFIYRAKLVSNGDNSKEICPFVRINALGCVKNSKVIQKTWTPVWNQVITLKKLTFINPERLTTSPPQMLVEVYDNDAVGRRDLIGRVEIEPVFEERQSYDYAPKLQWYDVFKGLEHAGQILMSTQICPLPETLLKTTEYDPIEESPTEGEETSSQPEEDESLPENLLPKSNVYKVDVYWWGLRDVNITRKPCVVLEIDDLNVKSDVIADIKSSSNFPNGRSSHTFESPLNDLYTPSMSIRLYDSSTFGRTMFLGTNVVKNPNKFIVKWLPKCEREACLKSTSIMSAGFCQVNSSLFVKKSKENSENFDDRQSHNVSMSSLSEISVKRSAWKKLFSRNEPSEEEYTLLPVYTKENDQIKVLRKSQKTIDMKHDWWTRFFNSQFIDDEESTPTGSITIYNSELELQPEFSKFKDWCSTLKLYNGKKTGIPEKDEHLQCGFLKAGIAIYRWPPPDDTEVVSCTGVELKQSFFDDHPSNDPTKILVRVYIVKAMNLSTKDFTGKSDPYVVIGCGKKHLGDRNSYIPNTVEPIFGKMYEFRCSLPEDYLLTVSLYDYDALPPDSLIGSTSIDLEDRFYTKHRGRVGLASEYAKTGSARWRDCVKPSAILEEMCSRNHIRPPEFPSASSVVINGVEYKDPCEKSLVNLSPLERKENICLNLLRNWQTLPICGYNLVPEHVETRKLTNPDQPRCSQGKVQLWLDIFPIDAYTNIPAPCDITPKSLKKYELRLIIWDVQSTIMNDYSKTGKIWKSVDLYVRAWIGCVEKAQHTDVHYNSVDGEATFNWRMIFHFLYQHAERKVTQMNICEIKLYTDKLILDANIPFKILTNETGPFTEYEEYSSPILVIQLLESDADECLGSLALDLNCMPRGVKFSRQCTLSAMARCKRINLFSWTSIRAWWPLKMMDNTSDKEIPAGVIDMELTLLPCDQACAMPVGIARDPPYPLPIPCRRCGHESSNYLSSICGCFENINVNEQILILVVIAIVFCIFIYVSVAVTPVLLEMLSGSNQNSKVQGVIRALRES